MRVICPGFADLVSHAEVVGVKLLCPVDDLIVGHTVVQRIVDGQQPFSRLDLIFMHSIFSFFATATSLA